MYALLRSDDGGGGAYYYLYFWPDFDQWRVGESYDSAGAVIGSRGPAKASACPEAVTGWDVWTSSDWESASDSCARKTVPTTRKSEQSAPHHTCSGSGTTGLQRMRIFMKMA